MKTSRRRMALIRMLGEREFRPLKVNAITLSISADL